MLASICTGAVGGSVATVWSQKEFRCATCIGYGRPARRPTVLQGMVVAETSVPRMGPSDWGGVAFVNQSAHGRCLQMIGDAWSWATSAPNEANASVAAGWDEMV
eukprot:347715-Chlamydomonas_euryale.AAC.4